MDGVHHRLAVADLGVRPVQHRIPFLIGGHGRRLVGIAARYADIFQFTGLTHGDGGDPSAGGFAIDALRLRVRWLAEAAANRLDDVERSALVQLSVVGDRAGERIDQTAEQFGVSREVVEQTPFILIGSVHQLVDKLELLRSDLGINHYVVRDAEGFAPVLSALSGH